VERLFKSLALEMAKPGFIFNGAWQKISESSQQRSPHFLSMPAGKIFL